MKNKREQNYIICMFSTGRLVKTRVGGRVGEKKAAGKVRN